MANLCADLCSYSVIAFYDHDGTAAANVFSVQYQASRALKRKRVRVST